MLTLRENLPSVSTNYLLTAALSWWGWFAIILILLAYVVLLAACYFACRKVKSTFGQMVVVAITSTWMIQILLYAMTNFIRYADWYLSAVVCAGQCSYRVQSVFAGLAAVGVQDRRCGER